MAIGSTALFNLIIILIIGIVVALVFNRCARSWLARLGNTTRSDVTAALVGIAGSFIGFHISVSWGCCHRLSCITFWQPLGPSSSYGYGVEADKEEAA